MHLKDRIAAFAELGNIVRNYLSGEQSLSSEVRKSLDAAIEESRLQNPWFTTDNIRLAMDAIGQSLKKELLEKWLVPYQLPDHPAERKRIAVISAGNIPLVGFHDMLSVLITGHDYIGKLSGKDQTLPKAMGKLLCSINPEFENRMVFTDKILDNFQAVIATGSNNSSRYFDYYFGKYPNIIRKNRNSVAVLTGKESQEDLQLLANDIFQYFGLGCRNVSMIYLPEGFDMPRLIDNFEGYSFVINHHKYANNYEYNKAVFLVNQVPHFDSGFVLLKEDQSLSSPLGVLNYSYYREPDVLMGHLNSMANQIQCIVTSLDVPDAVPFGRSQKPELWDYADGVDIIRFLKAL